MTPSTRHVDLETPCSFEVVYLSLRDLNTTSKQRSRPVTSNTVDTRAKAIIGDGDASGKTMDRGASAYASHLDFIVTPGFSDIRSALKHTDITDGLHEDAKNDLGGAPAGEKTTGNAGSLFDKDGAIGKQFTTQGTIGGIAQSIGGPLDKEGMVGKQFTTGGSIGGAAQNMLAGSEKNTFQDKPSLLWLDSAKGRNLYQ